MKAHGHHFLGFFGLAMVVGLCGCQTPEPYDYTAFEAARPRSLLVLPPINDSADVKGTYGYYTTVTRPLAEKGYYVFPIGLVDQMFKENGLPEPTDMHEVPLQRISEIFGADAVLYIRIKDYGTNYVVLSSATTVSALVRLVSVHSGTELWSGSVVAQQASGSGGGGIIGALVAAAVTQIIGELNDQGHIVSALANQLIANELLAGPYLPEEPAK